jgi:hypothetical protein
MYKLTRITPSGEEKEQGPFSTVVDAALAASDFLRNEGLATRVEARWFASYVSGLPIGMDAVHPLNKHCFRIDSVEGGEQS